jgi:hypothetical protein
MTATRNGYPSRQVGASRRISQGMPVRRVGVVTSLECGRSGFELWRLTLTHSVQRSWSSRVFHSRNGRIAYRRCLLNPLANAACATSRRGHVPKGEGRAAKGRYALDRLGLQVLASGATSARSSGPPSARSSVPAPTARCRVMGKIGPCLRRRDTTASLPGMTTLREGGDHRVEPVPAWVATGSTRDQVNVAIRRIR